MIDLTERLQEVNDCDCFFNFNGRCYDCGLTGDESKALKKIAELELQISVLIKQIRPNDTERGEGVDGSCYCCNPDSGIDFGPCDISTCESRWNKWSAAHG